MLVTISKDLLSKISDFNVLAYSMDVDVLDSQVIENEIQAREKKISEEYSISDVLNIPLIKVARDSYKALGKDPSRYRLAVESLYRRIVKGNKLYRINSVVDAGNILSIDTMRSTAILDLDKILGDVYIRIGKSSDEYYGIGRGKIDVSDIPVYEDSLSPFGSTTSDTERTMITLNTKHIAVFIICFDNSLYEEDEKIMINLFTNYCNAKNIKRIEVVKEC